MSARLVFRALVAAAVFLGTQSPRVARAQEPTMAQCYDAHETGQLQRKRGQLQRARVSFGTCGRNVCPAVVQRDCVSWATELAKAQPSVVIAVVRDDGIDVLGARVFIDNASTPADGRGVELDPGEHKVRVDRPGEASFERRFAVREGDRARRVAIVLPSARDEARGLGRPPLLTYVFGGVAVLSLGSFGTFAVLGKSREDELGTSCGDRCSDAEVAEVRRSYLVADISLGVAAVAAGAAIVTWLVAPKTSKPATTASTASTATLGPRSR